MPWHTEKLTDDDRRLIYQLYPDMPVKDIATKFDVTPTTIYRLLRGDTWNGWKRRDVELCKCCGSVIRRD